jgi:hypothetical protein
MFLLPQVRYSGFDSVATSASVPPTVSPSSPVDVLQCLSVTRSKRVTTSCSYFNYNRHVKAVDVRLTTVTLFFFWFFRDNGIGVVRCVALGHCWPRSSMSRCDSFYACYKIMFILYNRHVKASRCSSYHRYANVLLILSRPRHQTRPLLRPRPLLTSFINVRLWLVLRVLQHHVTTL